MIPFHFMPMVSLYLGYPGTSSCASSSCGVVRPGKVMNTLLANPVKPREPVKLIKPVKPIKAVISRFTNNPQQVHYVVLPPC